MAKLVVGFHACSLEDVHVTHDFDYYKCSGFRLFDTLDFSFTDISLSEIEDTTDLIGLTLDDSDLGAKFTYFCNEGFSLGCEDTFWSSDYKNSLEMPLLFNNMPYKNRVNTSYCVIKLKIFSQCYLFIDPIRKLFEFKYREHVIHSNGDIGYVIGNYSYRINNCFDLFSNLLGKVSSNVYIIGKFLHLVFPTDAVDTIVLPDGYSALLLEPVHNHASFRLVVPPSIASIDILDFVFLDNSTIELVLCKKNSEKLLYDLLLRALDYYNVYIEDSYSFDELVRKVENYYTCKVVLY